jgi:hypothetical protein
MYKAQACQPRRTLFAPSALGKRSCMTPKSIRICEAGLAATETVHLCGIQIRNCNSSINIYCNYRNYCYYGSYDSAPIRYGRFQNQTSDGLSRFPTIAIGLGRASEYSRIRMPMPPQKSTTFILFVLLISILRSTLLYSAIPLPD